MRKVLAVGGVVVVTVLGMPLASASAAGSGALGAARDAEPVVLTGAQIPGWAEPAAAGTAAVLSGTSKEPGEPGQIPGVGLRSAHNGTLVVPPNNPAVSPVDPGTVVAYSYGAGGWKEVPVQVDKRFLDFLANGRSSFGIYSGTDPELTYAWGSDGHAVGQESWKRLFGTCSARFASSLQEVDAAIASGLVTLGAGETDADYLASMQDPQKSFDTDDELSFMASDAGQQAPSGVTPPAGTSDGQVVSLADPQDPAAQRFVYLFTRPGGSSFNAANGYVHMSPNADSAQWIDRDSFSADSPDLIGKSNTGYGPNLPETVCTTAPGNIGKLATPDGQPRQSGDANPRDGFTVTTPTYEVTTRGRWLVDGLHVTAPGTTGQYGPNIISRWKGRAFQQTPDASVSVVGFEDEQVNWEMNSSLLGWRQGPVRAMREVWGADSGTNVTKTEYYYRDADVFSYHLRVHPIPPDGLYTDWDYRPGVATEYYNLANTAGVPINGRGTVGDVTNVHSVGGQQEDISLCDPAKTVCSALQNPEEVAGDGFGLVYEFELTSPTAVTGANLAILPYYRDDACFDDGTGDAPVPRPFPGEKSTSQHVQDGYLAYWKQYAAAHGLVGPSSYADLRCQPAADPTTTPPWQITPFQGAIGENGVHFLFTQDSDNAFSPQNTDEVDGQQWRFEIPMAHPANQLVPYGLDVSAKLVPAVTPFAGAGGPGTDLPEVPLAAALPVGGLLVGGWWLRRRRR